MAEKFKFKRGFKTDAERKAEYYRKVLGYNYYDPLPAVNLANHLGLKIFTPIEIFNKNCAELEILMTSNEWSALTLKSKSGNNVIIHNNNHSIPRQESNLMHELAHNICKHETIQQSKLDGIDILMRNYNEEQEKEAEWLGSCLQLPRNALLWALKNNMSENEITEYYSASLSMVNYRINITGVKNQYKPNRRRRINKK